MYDRNQFLPHHQYPNFTFFYSRQKFHVDKHPLVTDYIFFAKVHKFTKLMKFDMIISSFSTLYFGVEGKTIAWLILSFILNLNPPNTLTSWASVLFEDSFSIWKTHRERFIEVLCVIINVGIGWHKPSLSEFDKSWFGSKVGHRIRMSHSG